MTEDNFEIIFSLTGLGLSILAFIIVYLIHTDYFLDPEKCPKNNHGIPFKFVYQIGDYYKIKFYDKETKSWLYYKDASIDVDSYHDEAGYAPSVNDYTCRLHEVSENIPNYIRSIDDLKRHNQEQRDRVSKEYKNWLERVKRSNERVNKLT